MPVEDKNESCGYFAGWVSGIAALIVGAPFEAVKTKQQHLGIGFRDSFHTIVRLEGYLGFFRGLAVPIMITGPFTAVYFGLYGNVMSYIKRRNEYQLEQGQTSKPNAGVTDPAFMSKAMYHNLGKMSESPRLPSANNVSDHVAAGTVAGLIQVVLMCPVEVVRTRQLAYGSMVKSPISCFMGVYRARGIAGLYKGLFPLAARNLGGGILQGLVYTTVLERLDRDNKDKVLTWFHFWLAGGFAGMVSWWVVAPLDVIKTKIQADEMVSPKYTGTLNCARKILASDGRLGLFRGMMSLSLPLFLVNGATFLVFNWASVLC